MNLYLIRTPAGAGIVLLVVFALVMLAGCTEEPTGVALTADDCAPVEVRCYR